MFKIELGKEVQSRMTSFTGIVSSRCECLYGCNRYCVQPKIGRDKKMGDSYYFDEDDLEIIGEGVAHVPKNTGGPISRVC